MNQAYYALATLQATLDDRFGERKERGATAVEYGLMVGLIAVVIIVAIAALGENLTDIFTGTSNELGSTAEEAGLNTEPDGEAG